MGMGGKWKVSDAICPERIGQKSLSDRFCGFLTAWVRPMRAVLVESRITLDAVGNLVPKMLNGRRLD